jgi:hypothetical protein
MKEIPMRFAFLLFCPLMISLFLTSPVVADAFLSNDEIKATQIDKDLEGTLNSGNSRKVVFSNGGQATASFDNNISGEVSSDGWWKLKSNGKICLKIENFMGGNKKCVKIKKSRSSFEFYAIKAGKSIFDYTVR